LTPDSGTISVNGVSPIEAVANRRIGLVSQGAANLLPHLNVFANVALPCAVATRLFCIRNLSFTQKKSVVRALRTARIQNAARLRPYECSGGMIARAMLARALVPRPHPPSLLVLDEAFSQLDEITAEALYADLQTIAQSLKMMIVIVSHHLNEVCLLCDRVYPLIRQQRSASSSIGAAVLIDLPSPRTSQVYSYPEFLRARSEIRASLSETRP